MALLNLAQALLLVGELDRALVAAEESVVVADELGEPVMRRMAHQARVDVHSGRGDLELAMALQCQTLLIGPVDPWREVRSLAMMAAWLIATGRRERACAWLERWTFNLTAWASDWQLPELFSREVGKAMQALGSRARDSAN